MGGPEAEALRKRQREAKRKRRARFYGLGLNSQGRPMRNRKAPPRPVYEPPHPPSCPCYDCLYGNRPKPEDLPHEYHANTETPE
jgi:hypothetical protein